MYIQRQKQDYLRLEILLILTAMVGVFVMSLLVWFLVSPIVTAFMRWFFN